jgi:hypothetical protein
VSPGWALSGFEEKTKKGKGKSRKKRETCGGLFG